MKRSYVVREPKRLDQVVYEVYGNLEYFEEVLELNKDLLHKKVLEPDDIVKLVEPRPKPQIVEEKALWN